MYLIFVCKKNILKTSALIGVIDNKVGRVPLAHVPIYRIQILRKYRSTLVKKYY